MTWDEVMDNYPAAEKMAKTFALKASEPDVEQDILQHLLLDLYETCDLSRCRTNVKNFVAGVMWNSASTYLWSGRNGKHRRTVSLDELVARAGASGEDSSSPDVVLIRSLVSP